MEFMEIIASFISTVGFPIFIAVFFLLRLKKQDDRHAEQFDQLTVAINNNTKVIQELSYKLEERENNK